PRLNCLVSEKLLLRSVVVTVEPALDPASVLDTGRTELLTCGVYWTSGSKIPSSARSCVSANFTSARATSMSLLFSSARRIDSLSVSGRVLPLCTPRRVKGGKGGTGRGVDRKSVV